VLFLSIILVLETAESTFACVFLYVELVSHFGTVTIESVQMFSNRAHCLGDDHALAHASYGAMILLLNSIFGLLILIACSFSDRCVA
jgi:hypothetical protein